jgi:RimJ/RimL family protein N-acetyltransferase
MELVGTTPRLQLWELSPTDARAPRDAGEVGGITCPVTFADGWRGDLNILAGDKTAFLMKRTDDGVAVGLVGLRPGNVAGDVLWLTYEVAARVKCQRYASEAVAPLVERALENQPNVRCIRAEIHKGNHGSEGVARAAGLKLIEQLVGGAIWERCR